MFAYTIAEILIVFLLFLIGASAGSFLNVVILRVIAQKPSLGGRSQCMHCKKTLTARELVPIISYSLQAGKCRSCSSPISAQYPIIEFTAGILFVSLLVPLPASISMLCAQIVTFIALCLLLVLFVVDLKTFILPDVFIVMLAVAAVLRQALVGGMSASNLGWAVVVGAGFLLAIWLLTRGAGIGFGDVKLMIGIALLLGLTGVVTVLFLAFIAGGLLGGALLITKKAGPKTPLPFGPFLGGAAMLVLMWPSITFILQNVVFSGIL